jgi:N-acetylmuramoyl-L-alanine amidase
MNKVVLIDNGHGIETPGKRSPDGKLKEGVWAREMASLIVRSLCSAGIDARLLTPEPQDIGLSLRVERVNSLCRKIGADNVLVDSIHINAAGNGNSWNAAMGFLSFVAPNAGSGSKRLARLFYEASEKRGLKGNRWVPKEKYMVKSLAICRDTKCAAVLTENLFMDNPQDCAYLLSDEGKKTIAAAHVEAIMKYIAS